jgi:hypothetical protein
MVLILLLQILQQKSVTAVYKQLAVIKELLCFRRTDHHTAPIEEDQLIGAPVLQC